MKRAFGKIEMDVVGAIEVDLVHLVCMVLEGHFGAEAAVALEALQSLAMLNQVQPQEILALELLSAFWTETVFIRSVNPLVLGE